jgi:hypothetical protein
MRKILFTISFITAFYGSKSQDYRWQQRVEYGMDVKFNTQTHKIEGIQKLVYHNNSPDTLIKVYYHLYFNAFQPGSMMDVRSRTIADPDPRVRDRIAKLKEDDVYSKRNYSRSNTGKTHITTYQDNL